MQKKRAPSKRKKEAVTNALVDAFFPTFAGYGTPLNQTSTLWKNNRWYLISNFWQLLSESYVEHGIIQTVVDVPVDDAFRGGWDIKSKQLDPEQIDQLHAVHQEYNDIQILAQANKWKRLYGGGGNIIVTDQNPATPFDMDKIREGDKLAFHAVDMWELSGAQINPNQGDIPYGYGLPQDGLYNYYGVKLHPSRVMKLVGIEAPSFIRPRLRGWGVSVVEVLVNSINNYLKNNNLVFELLDEYKIDVYKFKDLAATLLSAGQSGVHSRVQAVNLQKNYQHALVLDKEDEWDHKQLTFSGIAEILQEIRMQMASDMRMPITKVFGVSAQGFNAGQDDLENYNGMIESTIRSKNLIYAMKVTKLRCAQQFGFIPDDLTISFKPLRVLTAEQEENVKTHRVNRTLQTAQAGFCTAEEFKLAVNRDELLPIQLDPSIEKIEMGNADGESGEVAEPPKSKLSPKGPKE